MKGRTAESEGPWDINKGGLFSIIKNRYRGGGVEVCMKTRNTPSSTSSCGKSSCLACSFFFPEEKLYIFLVRYLQGPQPDRLFTAHCKPKRNTYGAVKEIRYIRGLRRAGLQCKLSPGRIKTLSQPRISTDSCQGLLIWEKRRKFACAVLVSFSSYINHSLTIWCVSNHQHAWTALDKRGNELQLCSSRSHCFSSATRAQPGLLEYKSWAFGTSCCRLKKGGKVQVPRELVCVLATLQKIWLICCLANDSSEAAGGLPACLQLLCNSQSPAPGILSEVLGWPQQLWSDPSDTVSFALWRARRSYPGGHSKVPDQTSTGTVHCDRTQWLPVSVEARLLPLWPLEQPNKLPPTRPCRLGDVPPALQAGHAHTGTFWLQGRGKKVVCYSNFLENC